MSSITAIATFPLVYAFPLLGMLLSGSLLFGLIIVFCAVIWVHLFMEYRKREFPKFFPSGHYPPNTLLMVDRLVKEEFLVEVQAIAAI